MNLNFPPYKLILGILFLQEKRFDEQIMTLIHNVQKVFLKHLKVWDIPEILSIHLKS